MSWGPSFDPRLALVGKLMFLLLALLDFAVAFMAGFFNALSFRKRYLEDGEIDWQKHRQLRLRSLGYSVVGAIMVQFRLTPFVTNVGPLTLIGLRGYFAIEIVFFLVALFGGLGFLGNGLGFGIGSLVFPVKKPQQIDKPYYHSALAHMPSSIYSKDSSNKLGVLGLKINAHTPDLFPSRHPHR